ncbi:MAG: hypothetical protein KAG61_01575 [Bacteriovoracaceae bacterium]|nr:hypothetical protein [Bacteriovoracaceae bacterium]
MSEEQTVVSDNTAISSGESEKQSVSYETHKKLLGQMKNAKVESERVNARLAEFEAKQEADAENKLKEDNEWKTLAEKKDAELIETRGTLSRINDSIVRAEKIDAVEKELGAALKNRDYARHLDLDSISVSESGEIDQEALSAEVNRFREVHGDSLIKTNNIATLPNGAGQKSQPKSIGDMTAQERQALRRELRKK